MHCHNETQIECPGGVDDDGCELQTTCVQIGHGYSGQLCSGFCPAQCKDNENKCPGGTDPETDCALPDVCIPKQINNNGEYCSSQACPLTCEHGEHLCKGAIQLDGCREEDRCTMLVESKQGELCGGTCPIECKDGWIKCQGITSYTPPHEGCIGQDICHIKFKDKNYQYCPDESASHGCPKACPPDEVLCPPAETELGCLLEKVCRPRSKDEGGNYCPDSSDCPTVCKPYEINCAGGISDDGCKLPDLCIKQHRDFNGDQCPFHCPQVCSDEQVLCPGQRNPITGCIGSDQCKDKGYHRWGLTRGALCPGWCSAICNDHEVLCPSYVDPCNGCPTEEVCREAVKDVNGIFCPGKEFTQCKEGRDFIRDPMNLGHDGETRRGGYLSASHNCPLYCREDKGYIECPVYEDKFGCKPEALCGLRTKVLDGSEWCPMSSVCPKQCSKRQKLCQYEMKDKRGCKVEDLCVNIDTDDQGNLCEMDWCPPHCAGDQYLIGQGEDEKGCAKEPKCVWP